VIRKKAWISGRNWRERNMLIWLTIAILLAMLGVVEMLLGFTMPFTGLRTILLFLLVLGMAYSLYLKERGVKQVMIRKKINIGRNTLFQIHKMKKSNGGVFLGWELRIEGFNFKPSTLNPQPSIRLPYPEIVSFPRKQIAPFPIQGTVPVDNDPDSG